MAARPMAQSSRLWRNESHSAANLHFGTSSRRSDTLGPQDTSHTTPIFSILGPCSDVLFTALQNLDCFQLPFNRDGRDGITASVYADKGFQEAVFVNVWVELFLQAAHNQRKRLEL